MGGRNYNFYKENNLNRLSKTKFYPNIGSINHCYGLLIFFSLRCFGILDCSYITFMIVSIINKNIIMKYITHYKISLNLKKFNKTTIKIIITRNAQVRG